MKLSLGLAMCALTMTGWAQLRADHEVLPEPPMLGLHTARGEAHSGAGKAGSPLLVYHQGPILPTTATAAIFWGNSWSDPNFVGDKITGLDSFYSGVGGSNYAKTSDEYTANGGFQVMSGISYSGHYTDFSAAPSHAPSTSTILNKVCQTIGGQIVPNGYYVVYVDTKRHVSYCAWHSWGQCGGTPIEFGFVFNLDGDTGCDPGDTFTGHSQGLAAVANVSGHELSETRTDPQGTGWLDQQGQENGDKCAWSFGSDSVPFSNKTSWRIQGNWSNTAYQSSSLGYANLSGQKGCLDGGTYPPVAP